MSIPEGPSDGPVVDLHQHEAKHGNTRQHTVTHGNIATQRVNKSRGNVSRRLAAVCCSVLQRVAVCCNGRMGWSGNPGVCLTKAMSISFYLCNRNVVSMHSTFGNEPFLYTTQLQTNGNCENLLQRRINLFMSIMSLRNAQLLLHMCLRFSRTQE